MQICLGAALVLSATAAPLAHGSHALRQVSLLSQQHNAEKHHVETQVALVADGAGEPRHFGDTLCPCIGFDNIEGTTMVTIEGKEIGFPADMGARCKPWDDGLHPHCKVGETPGLGAGWCASAWCYVDPCNCDIPILPKVSQYVPQATYRGKPLFFSYNTCGGEDTWSKAIPEVGTPGCRCIGFDNQQGTLQVMLGDKKAEYPAELGGTCRAWDEENHPGCKGDSVEDWCKAKWCFVDPCSCKLPDGAVPKISFYLPEASFTGKGLYFSYETCGNPDLWTKNNEKACVNQMSQDACNNLDRCGWTGTRCLGKELTTHPLCVDDLAEIEKQEPPKKKSGASRGGAGLAAAAALIAALARAA